MKKVWSQEKRERSSDKSSLLSFVNTKTQCCSVVSGLSFFHSHL